MTLVQNIGSTNSHVEPTEYSIPQDKLFVPNSIGKITATYRGREFYVLDRNQREIQLERAFLSKDLRGISTAALEKCLNVSYLALNKVGESYSLTLKHRLSGGGPLTGFIGYWGTKLLCYGTATALATSAVVATGGAAAGVIGVVGTSTSSVVVLGGVASAAETIAGAGTVAATITAVETASTSVGLWLLACPFLP